MGAQGVDMPLSAVVLTPTNANSSKLTSGVVDTFAMQSYNHPAWQYSPPPHYAVSFDVPPSQIAARPRYASETGSPLPHMSQTSINASPTIIPPSLTPGAQRSRTWDKSPVQRPRTAMSPPYHSPQRSLYGDYFFSQPHAFASPPPLPQKPQSLLNPLPPIPPKPPALTIAPASRIPLYPTSIPLPMANPFSPPPEPIPQETVSDEKEIERALTLSAIEARKHEEELIAQEEEELARALEESRLLSNVAFSLELHSPSSSAPPRSPSIDRVPISAIKPPAHPPEGESWLHIITPTTSTSSHRSSINEDFSPLPSPAPKNDPEDDPVDFTRGTSSSAQNLHESWDALPPLYANVVSNLVRNPCAPSLSRSTLHSPPSLSSSTTYLPSEIAPSSEFAPVSPSLSLTHSSSSEHLPMPPFASRPSWASISSESSTSAGRSPFSELVLSSNGHKSPTQSPTSPDPSFVSSTNLDTLDESEEDGAEPGPSRRPSVPLTANQYVEREMLVGISLGFNLPVISTESVPMAGTMPNVITLPYGRAPLFHLQAPSWRRLLKLMARLSGTRVEPTVEALSIAKHDLKLRTVIQFVKIHHSASEWRTVLYLTTDHPVPPNVQNSYKYTNGDVSILPYSYSLSPLPTLLRDGSESPMAKYYVVPSTATTPHPNLPINFPNLAMYLQSAVQDSRRAASDSSSGLRKLAQYIDGCYHSDAERGLPMDEVMASKKGVGGMIKRVIGRNKSNKNSRGNDEIYDLVTPFVPDEWG